MYSNTLLNHQTSLIANSGKSELELQTAAENDYFAATPLEFEPMQKVIFKQHHSKCEPHKNILPAEIFNYFNYVGDQFKS